jgi:Peptidase inhibitor family I36
MAQLWSGTNYTGTPITLYYNGSPVKLQIANNPINSLKVQQGYALQLFTSANFQGTPSVFNGPISVPNLTSSGIGNIQSLILSQQGVYTTVGPSGTPMTGYQPLTNATGTMTPAQQLYASGQRIGATTQSLQNAGIQLGLNGMGQPTSTSNATQTPGQQNPNIQNNAQNSGQTTPSSSHKWLYILLAIIILIVIIIVIGAVIYFVLRNKPKNPSPVK